MDLASKNIRFQCKMIIICLPLALLLQGGGGTMIRLGLKNELDAAWSWVLAHPQYFTIGNVMNIAFAVLLLMILRITGIFPTPKSTLDTFPGGSILLLALLAGIWEELAFRGVLQPLVGGWVAMTLFVLIHLDDNARPRKDLLFMFPAALLFTRLRNESGSVLPGIVAHSGIDLIVYSVFILERAIKNRRAVQQPTLRPLPQGVRRQRPTRRKSAPFGCLTD